MGLLVAALAVSAQRVIAAPGDDTWQFSVGAGVASAPKYPGSDSRRTEFIPIVAATYGRFFLGSIPAATASPIGIGFDLYRDSQWRFGAAVSGNIRKPRQESDDARLSGLGDIDRTARAGLFTTYTGDWFSLRAYVGSDIGNKKQGTLATLEIEKRFHPTDQLTLSAGPGVTWADNEYTRTFFGIDAEQSERSGLPQFEAKSGVSAVRFSVGADYRIDSQWNLGARLAAVRLRGDAADSPITQSKSQNTFAIFTAYRF
jgi:MipA family protein